MLPIVVIVAVWEAWVRLRHVPLYLMPKPLAVLEGCFTEFPQLHGDIRSTLTEIGAGFLLSICIGIPLAFLLDASAALEGAAYPFLIGSQVLPVVALAPVIIAWFGFGLTPKLVVIVIFDLFVIVLNTLAGLKSFQVEQLYLAQSMGASQSSIMLRLKVPNALPNIFIGLKLAATFAVIGAVVGEFVSSENGLGHAVVQATSNFDTVTVFVAIIYLVIIGTAIYALMDGFERLAIGWHVSRRLGRANVV